MINESKNDRTQILSSSSCTLVYDFSRNWVTAQFFRKFL